jgi:hypothetical protein
MRVIDDMNVGWRILLWPEVALHPDYPFKDELPYNFRQEDDKYSRCFCYDGQSSKPEPLLFNLESACHNFQKPFGIWILELDVSKKAFSLMLKEEVTRSRIHLGHIIV